MKLISAVRQHGWTERERLDVGVCSLVPAQLARMKALDKPPRQGHPPGPAASPAAAAEAAPQLGRPPRPTRHPRRPGRWPAQCLPGAAACRQQTYHQNLRSGRQKGLAKRADTQRLCSLRRQPKCSTIYLVDSEAGASNQCRASSDCSQPTCGRPCQWMPAAASALLPGWPAGRACHPERQSCRGAWLP